MTMETLYVARSNSRSEIVVGGYKRRLREILVWRPASRCSWTISLFLE